MSTTKKARASVRADGRKGRKPKGEHGRDGTRLPDSRPAASESYHHGKDVIRSLMIRATLQIISEEGPGAVTVRAAHRRAKQISPVSFAAARYHFPGGPRELLSGVAEDGYEKLRAVFAEVWARHADDQVRRLTEIGLAYVRFAVTHPAEFVVMMNARYWNPQSRRLPEVRTATLQYLRDAIAELGPAAVPQKHLVLTAWALVHGFAALWTDETLELMGATSRGDDPLELAAAVIDLTQRGFLGAFMAGE